MLLSLVQIRADAGALKLKKKKKKLLTEDFIGVYGFKIS